MGDITAEVLNRLNPITKGHPAKIFIQIGINDFWNQHISVYSALKNFTKIIKTIKRDSPKTKYIQKVSSLPM